MGHRIPDDELLADLARVAEALDDAPTKQECRERGQFSPATITRRFDRFGLAVNATDTEYIGYVTAEHVIEDIRAVKERLGEVPSRTAYTEHGQFSGSVATERFGRWNEALRAAGFDPVELAWAGPDEELLEDLVRVAGEMDKPPPEPEYIEHGDYHPRTLETRFDEKFTVLAREAFAMAGELAAPA